MGHHVLYIGHQIMYEICDTIPAIIDNIKIIRSILILSAELRHRLKVVSLMSGLYISIVS